MDKRRIGFVDDDLNNFHANTYLDTIQGPLAARNWVVSGATALQQAAGAKWAEAKRVEYFASVDQLVETVDAVCILAPSTPATHLGLCEAVLPHGKPTFVDKTFAPDTATARKIFDLSARYSAPIQTTSALRTTDVQAAVRGLSGQLQAMAISAGGASFEEYGIHPVELAVSCLGADVQRMTGIGQSPHLAFLIEWTGGRTATIQFNAASHIPFSAMLSTDDTVQYVAVDDKTLFVDAAAAILDFFDAGRPQVPREETMAVLKILESAPDALTSRGWIDLGSVEK